MAILMTSEMSRSCSSAAVSTPSLSYLEIFTLNVSVSLRRFARKAVPKLQLAAVCGLSISDMKE